MPLSRHVPTELHNQDCGESDGPRQSRLLRATFIMAYTISVRSEPEALQVVQLPFTPTLTAHGSRSDVSKRSSGPAKAWTFGSTPSGSRPPKTTVAVTLVRAGSLAASTRVSDFWRGWIGARSTIS